MVERTDALDAVFGALSDPTRRDILKRVSKKSMSIGEIARHYELTFAAVAKHLVVLERAALVTKTRQGKEQIVTIAPLALAAANTHLEYYRELWQGRLESLDQFLRTLNRKGP